MKGLLALPTPDAALLQRLRDGGERRHHELSDDGGPEMAAAKFKGGVDELVERVFDEMVKLQDKKIFFNTTTAKFTLADVGLDVGAHQLQAAIGKLLAAGRIHTVKGEGTARHFELGATPTSTEADAKTATKKTTKATKRAGPKRAATPSPAPREEALRVHAGDALVERVAQRVVAILEERGFRVE
jgi:hypothetical protein